MDSDSRYRCRHGTSDTMHSVEGFWDLALLCVALHLLLFVIYVLLQNLIECRGFIHEGIRG